MPYIGIVNFDYTGLADGNARYLLGQALEEVGWDYAETSAFTITSEDYEPIAMGIELIARAADHVGDLSALSIVVQLVDPTVTVPGARRRDPVANIARTRPSRLP